MPTMEEVAKQVETEIARIGQDTKKLTESFQRELAEAKSLAKTAEAKGEATNGELEAHKAAALAKLEALEKQTQTIETTVGTFTEQLEKMQAAFKRPGGMASAEEVAKRHQAALQFKTAALSLKGKLELDTDVGSMVDLDEFDAYAKAFGISLRRNKEMVSHEQHKALSVGEDPAGGYLVTPAMSARIISIIRETSPLRQFATVETIGTDKLEMPRDLEDVGFGWVGEQESRTETSTPQVGIANIPVHEMYAEPRATQKFLEDASVNAEAWLAGKIADRFARAEATAFINGNGVNKPRGLLTYPTAATGDATRAWGTFEHIVSGGATTLTPDAIVKMPLQLKEGYVAGARWLMNRLTVQAIMLLKDEENRYLWQPDFTKGVQQMLVGFPISMATDMPVLAADSLSVAFGDFGRTYTVVDRLGITTLRDPYTAKPFVKFYSRRRVGGDVVHFESVKFIKTASS